MVMCLPIANFMVFGVPLSFLLQVYIYLKGVDQERIETGFTPSSFFIKFHDVEGMNYKFAIPALHKEIVPANCRVITRPEKVVISLVKASRDYWLDLKFKEERVLHHFFGPPILCFGKGRNGTNCFIV